MEMEMEMELEMEMEMEMEMELEMEMAMGMEMAMAFAFRRVSKTSSSTTKHPFLQSGDRHSHHQLVHCKICQPLSLWDPSGPPAGITCLL